MVDAILILGIESSCNIFSFESMSCIWIFLITGRHLHWLRLIVRMCCLSLHDLVITLFLQYSASLEIFRHFSGLSGNHLISSIFSLTWNILSLFRTFRDKRKKFQRKVSELYSYKYKFRTLKTPYLLHCTCKLPLFRFSKYKYVKILLVN